MQLQTYLSEQTTWTHNFGLAQDHDGTVIGKMFGVLVVRLAGGNAAFLAAFSGKLGGGNHHPYFVPPVYDALTTGSFLNEGMQHLARINKQIRELEPPVDAGQLNALLASRRNHSHVLQQQLFDHYHFLNRAGDSKSLSRLFHDAGYQNPPSGAGECAGPKLLQYAFQHQLQPLALAEFWWGRSPKSAQWKHRQYYPCCKDKCGPILVHMLHGIDRAPAGET